MSFDLNWSEQEFNTILMNPHSTDYELSAKLNGRHAEAIGNLRAFIHNFHTKGNISGLSKFMVARLNQGYWECPRCHHRALKDDFPANKGWMQ
ncbi:MAG: hypothetical protein JW967_07535 [Dehalococcoidales bacterium]|nr:hypothetical protein [Dehalococcoidales bacterium]